MNFYKANKVIVVSLGLFFTFSNLNGADNKIDPTTNLVVDKGFNTVVENCLTCHPSDLIINKQRSRKEWAKLIKWMQTNVGLWEFEPQTEKTILDYLEKYYSHSKKEELVPNLNLNNIR